MRLIFVEGVPGVGKSTVTAKLCDILINQGFSAKCYLEADLNNPIDLYWYAYLTKSEYENILVLHDAFAEEIAANSVYEDEYVLVRYQDFESRYYSPELYEYFKAREVCYKARNPVPYEMFTRIFFDRWRSFLSSDLSKQDFLIFDGAFLAHQINDLIRNYNPTDDKIIRHLETIWQIIKPYTPVAFYLESQDIWERIRAANINRLQTIPPKEQTPFWENRKRIDVLALDRLPIEFHRFDISDESWDSAIDTMVMLIQETDKKRQAKIYPIILSEYNPA